MPPPARGGGGGGGGGGMDPRLAPYASPRWSVEGFTQQQLGALPEKARAQEKTRWLFARWRRNPVFDDVFR
jgi:hypothetical protein